MGGDISRKSFKLNTQKKMKKINKNETNNQTLKTNILSKDFCDTIYISMYYLIYEIIHLPQKFTIRMS